MRDLRRAFPVIPLLMLNLLLLTGCASFPPRFFAARSTGVPGGLVTSTALSPANPTEPPSPSPQPSPTSTATMAPTPTPTRTPTTSPPTSTSIPETPSPTPSPPPPTVTPTPSPQPFVPLPPSGRSFATLDEFWAGSAEWILEIHDVGLPVGESDTVYRGGGEFWSYLHASHQSAGIVDSCGNPAPFPGCVTLWRSHDGGLTFSLDEPVCLFPCSSCPCDPSRDHPGQQQYPRVFFAADRAYIVYEWGAATYLRTSQDGLRWSAEARVPGTGQWRSEAISCAEAESIGEHPNIYDETEFGDCLVGAPPGIIAEGDLLYVFVGLGRDPGHMGCYVGNGLAGPGSQAVTATLTKCASNPLFGAENGYGRLDARGAEANPFFEFRTISSADVVRVGDRFYMAYEGVRGPSDPSVVDDQFALGFARSVGPAVDGPWEKYPGNPVIMDVTNNWGIGHGDLVIVGPATYLYTATSQTTRGRYALVRR